MKTVKLFNLLFILIFHALKSYSQLEDKTIYIQPANDTNMVNLAEELADYLQQIEGNTYTIATNGYDDTGILLAIRENTQALSDSDKATLTGMNGEAFLSDVNARRILIIGNERIGVQHGIFDFVKRLGCKFLTPSPAWTIIPSNPNWAFTHKKFDEPDFISRNLWYANGDGDGFGPVLTQNAKDRVHFFRATQQGSIITRQGNAYPATFAVGHSYQDDLAADPDEFKAHPEYFATKEDGTRYTWQDYLDNGAGGDGISLEYSNLDLAHLMLENRIEWLNRYRDENPKEFMITIEPNDGSNISYHPAALALGNGADQVLHIANYVADSLAKRIPGAQASIYIYPSHLVPPENTTVSPHLYGQLALAFNSSNLSFNEIAVGWKNAGLQNFGIYDYLGEYQWDMGLPLGQPTVTLDYIKKHLPFIYNKWNVRSFSAESQANWMRGGPSYYVARKLLWDIHANADSLYTDWIESAFGNAAEPMKELYDNWEHDPSQLRSENTYIKINRWLQLIQQAFNQVDEGTPEYKRVEDMYSYVHYSILFHEFYEAERAANPNNDTLMVQNAALPLLKYGYRIRRRHVIQFWAFQLRLLFEHSLLENFDRWDGWNFFEMDTHPTLWMDNGDDFTSNEMQQMLANDLAEYTEESLIKSYSKKLVPLYPDKTPSLIEPLIEPFDQTKSAGPFGPTKWYFQAETNENLSIEMRQSNVYSPSWESEIGQGYIKNTATAAYVFDKRLENSYFNGEYQINDINNLQLTKGLYEMAFDNGDYNTYFPIFDTPHRFVLEASEEHPLSYSNWTPMYFYVPADVDTILLHYDWAYINIKAPSQTDGIQHGVDELGFLKIPVTNDMDRDTLWEIRDLFWVEAFYFLNIPPYLSDAPENMLVPEPLLTAVSEVKEPFNFQIFPNPTSGEVYIILPKQFSGEVVVKDIAGRQLLSKQIIGRQTSLSLNHLVKGIYFIELKNGSQVTSKKLLLF